MGFDRADLVDQAGFTEGDILPVASFASRSKSIAQTTSTSFTRTFNLCDQFLPERFGVADGPTIRVRLTARLNPGTGETYEVRVRGGGTGQITPALSATGGSGANLSTGWVTPVNIPSAPDRVTVEHRTDPGSNASEVTIPVFQVGVEL